MNDDVNPFMLENDLQIRLLNFVVDEVSDYERDQLLHLMEQRPDLKLYVEHLQHVHGLLATVGSGDWESKPLTETNESEWKLPEDRRSKLLAILDNATIASSTGRPMTLVSPIVKNKRISFGIRFAVLAASIGVVAGVFMLPAMYTERLTARWTLSSARSRSTEEKSKPFYLDGNLAYSESDLDRGVGGGVSSRRSDLSPPFAAPDLSLETTPKSVTVPNSGTMMLGGIKRESNGQVDRGAVSIPQEDFAKQNIIASDKPGSTPRSAGNRSQGATWEESTALNRNGFSDTKKDTSAVGTESFARGLADPSANGPVAGIALDFIEAGKSNDERERIAAVAPKPANDWKDSVPTVPSEPVGASGGDVAAGLARQGDTAAEYALQENVEMGRAGMGGGPGIGAAGGDGFPPGTGMGFGSSSVGMSGPADGAGGYGQPSDLRKGANLSQTAASGMVDQLSAPTDGEKRADPERRDNLSLLSDSPQNAVPPSKKELSEVVGGLSPRDTKQSEYRLSESASESKVAAEQPMNRLSKNDSLGRDQNSLKMTVSPTIIVPENDEEQIRASAESRFGGESKNRSESLSRFASPSTEKAKGTDKVLLGKELGSSFDVELGVKQTQSTKPMAPVREVAASAEPFSTFSLHVSDVSFQLSHSALNQGQWPDRNTLRVEEFLNAFDYQDPTPDDAEMVACQIEQATHPFQMQRNLLRIAMKTGATGRALNMPLRLTVLLDISGSMERPDRKVAAQKAFQGLANQLRDQDQITLIAFANTPRLIADRFNAEQAKLLTSVIQQTPSQGGTNLEAALTLAREKAREQFAVGGQNRIVMLTDGAVNLGNADPNSLSQQIVELRNEGIAFDAAGICAQDLNDEVLETLARQGDGRYYLINADDATTESFSNQIAGALRPTAKNVKVQVEFNPHRVGHYRLLGFEKHQLKKEDFRNDRVDAAELAAAEAGVAMYQVEAKPDGTGDVGSVSVRFQDVATGRMVENRWPIAFSTRPPSVDAAKPTMRLASAATLFAIKLTGEPGSDRIDFATLAGLVSNLPSAFANQPRVQALLTMINQARSLGEPTP